MNRNVIKIDKFGSKRIVDFISKIDDPRHSARDNPNSLFGIDLKKKGE